MGEEVAFRYCSYDALLARWEQEGSGEVCSQAATVRKRVHHDRDAIPGMSREFGVSGAP